MKILSQQDQYGILLTDIDGMTLFVDSNIDDPDSIYSVYSGIEEEAMLREEYDDYCPVWLGDYRTREEAIQVVKDIASAIEQGKQVFRMPHK